MKKIKRIKIIINPSAGKHIIKLPFINKLVGIKDISYKQLSLNQLITTLHQLFEARDIQADICVSNHVGHCTSLAQEALSDKCDAVVVVGGDGSINEIASVLAGNSLPLGVIPYGTANVFALSFGIPFSLEAACDRISKGQSRAIDLGYSGDKLFVCMMGVGFDAYVIKCCKLKWKRLLGPFAFVLALLKAALTSTFTPISVTINHKPYSGSLFIVSNVANYAGNLTLCSEAEPDDGYLNISLFKGRHLWDIFRFLYCLSKGRVTHHQQVTQLKAKSLDFVTVRKQHTHVDAEYIGQKLDRIFIKEKALLIL
ncbi:MAG: YegS/Rv2252/BmrU family lipid kinase [bacterium]